MAFEESDLQGENIPACNFLYSADCAEKEAKDSTAARLRARSNQILSWMQPGLIYPAPYQCAINIQGVGTSLDRTDFAKILSDAREHTHTKHGSRRASVCIAFAPSIWSRFCEKDGLQQPTDINFENAINNGDAPEVVTRSNGVLSSDPIDAFFLVKADEDQAVAGITKFLVEQLQNLGFADSQLQCAYMNGREQHSGCPMHGGRVLGGRFAENLRNPSSPSEVLEHVLIGNEDPAAAGGAFVIAQRFRLNWPELNSRTSSEIEKLIGREEYTNELIPSFDSRSHIRSSHTYDANNHTIKLLRIGLPFGTRGELTPSSPLMEGVRAASATDEAGIYFIALAKSANRIERVLESQFGSQIDDGFGRDRLLNSGVIKSDLGGFFYAPSLRELAPERIISDIKTRASESRLDWKRFPAVDWERFNRHYKSRSQNNWMFYNHQDYLYNLGIRSDDEGDRPAGVSIRVQFLLERMFARWDDTWYRSQKPCELAPLRDQLERYFADPKNSAECHEIASRSSKSVDEDPIVRAADLIMDSSIAIRSAWAKRILCWLAGRPDEIGGRGDGGMDTADVHPLDLLAGSMPAQSLSQGRYFINYVKDTDEEAERYDWYTKGLGPNSGVGHVVPGYDVLLASGINGVAKQIETSQAELQDQDPGRASKALDFYAASHIALKGLSDHLSGLRDAAGKKLAALRPGQAIERCNLEELIGRLTWLADGNKPRNLLEALQLVFTGHSTLHLCGEPVAVGRLDQLLRPFFNEESDSEVELQEAIDCFWIKLAEKVLLNRIFIDDRQELGNMAMGHRAGSYPKGQSVNQWIQQLTVGGKNPDGSFEHSAVTIACLQASARLPFNAPVLSLRVSRDMPEDWRDRLLKLAARGQMSGGASPILMNDDKIIPAMAKSGDGFGPPADSAAAEKWMSKVRLEDAHNYAADGCYEPQFVGANWFTLGGAIMLKPLEHALNEGREIQSAGPVHLFGRNASFRSPHARDIEGYETLEELFFKHFSWGYAKQMEGSLRDFGRMETVCPAPLLSLFINDCLKKGQDIYGGGARYNVFGPCFTALANTINALWAIKTMCFDPETACTTLEELVPALLSNWGEKMVDPFIHTTVLARDASAISDATERFKYLRSIALQLPKWGRNQGAIDEFGNRIAARVAQIAIETMRDPKPGLAAQYVRCAEKYGSKMNPFGGFSMQPGVGTFASYVEQGIGCGASADGRLSGQPLATDMSPTPSPLDWPATPENQQAADGVAVLEGLRSDDSFGYANGAPIDINISEEMDADRLFEILDAFVDGAGSNVLTVTTADQETFLNAATSPEAHDLLRVRMGGWTEMFVAMYAVHQAVHPRRPLSI